MSVDSTCKVFQRMYKIEPLLTMAFRVLMVWTVDRCLTLRRLTSYIYGAPILDVSRSHTTTQHSR